MLDNLRGMGVFASVVDNGSFSGCAKELGITTSAVSQQIRSLENDLGVVLLHRSTRRISLTEVGAVFYKSCKTMLAAAEQGKARLSELRDELTGQIRIATTPELGVNHLLPALADWIAQHKELYVHFEADNHYIDLIESRIDIALRMTPKINDSSVVIQPLAKVAQILVASPEYLDSMEAINEPADLAKHQMISLSLMDDPLKLQQTHIQTGKKARLKLKSRMNTNNVFIMKSLALENHGLMRIMSLDVEKELASGRLVEVLPEWRLPEFQLYAAMLRREQQPTKIIKCLDVLQDYFASCDTQSILKSAS